MGRFGEHWCNRIKTSCLRMMNDLTVVRVRYVCCCGQGGDNRGQSHPLGAGFLGIIPHMIDRFDSGRSSGVLRCGTCAILNSHSSPFVQTQMWSCFCAAEQTQTVVILCADDTDCRHSLCWWTTMTNLLFDVCVCVCVWGGGGACVRVCVRACVPASLCARACNVCVCLQAGVFMCAYTSANDTHAHPLSSPHPPDTHT